MREYKAEFLGLRGGEIGRPRSCKLVVHAEDVHGAEQQLARLGYDRVQSLTLTEQPLSDGFAPVAAPAVPSAAALVAIEQVIAAQKTVLIPDPPAPDPPVVEAVKVEPIAVEPEAIVTVEPAPEASDPAPPSPRKTRTRKVG